MATEQSEAPTRPASDMDRAATIADILLGGGEGEESNDVLDDEETLSEETTDEVEESPETEDEESEVESEDDGEEETLQASADDDEDLTWEKILGVNEGQLNFDEEGNLYITLIGSVDKDSDDDKPAGSVVKISGLDEQPKKDE